MLREIIIPSKIVRSAVQFPTPTTLPRRGEVKKKREAVAPTNLSIATPGHEFLDNPKLFGLQPSLSVRTRIMIASFALMNMPPDAVSKSFEVAGYFPRIWPAKLRAAVDKAARENGDELDAVRSGGSRRKRVEKVALFIYLHYCTQS